MLPIIHQRTIGGIRGSKSLGNTYWCLVLKIQPLSLLKNKLGLLYHLHFHKMGVKEVFKPSSQSERENNLRVIWCYTRFTNLLCPFWDE